MTGANAVPLAVAALDPVIRLYPAKASSRSGELRFGPVEYDLALCYSTIRTRTPVTIEAGASKVDSAVPVTEGYFYPDPNDSSENPVDPGSDRFWAIREYYPCERVPMPCRINLVRGVNVVRLKVDGTIAEDSIPVLKQLRRLVRR
ncbi:hypothetical protein ACFO8O_04750 [Hephaestia sp. GCM10023244]|uniref:hypothetical protein n=1 Tax=unclassified Hephaestia TaxID=2631281 RepID=UPI002076E004|nr:hypothetical protein [Hephaestia sp. MAHUQ-44]MCM8730276.1 hypothetical protein [Hephaestia sp. MAHUQ-44]